MINLKYVISALLVALVAAPAAAQKSKDVLRIAITEPISRLDAYYAPIQDVLFFTQSIYSTLVRFDEKSSKFIPEIAKSWKRIDDTTLEFEIDERAKFSDGTPVTADDVVYMYNWRIDPNLRIPFAFRFAWGKGAEKVGPNTVRLYTKTITAQDLITIAYGLPIYESSIHSKLSDKSDYGRNPVGAGPMKVVSLDQNSGALVESDPAYVLGPKAHARRLLGAPIPDRQTQVAHLLAGSVEAIQAESKDEYDQLSKTAGFHGFSREQFNLLYITLDARGRSDQPALKDPRVRRAIFMAIDRNALAKNLIAGDATTINQMCFVGMTACPEMETPFPYDPAGAKRLLQEAGFADGFDLEIATRLRSRQAGIVVAGDLRKIGIRATARDMTVNAFRKYREEGKVQVMVGDSPIGNIPDTANAMTQQYGSPTRDFATDDLIYSLMAKGEATHDLEQRSSDYRKIHERMFEEAYSYPLTTWPETWILRNDTQIYPGTWNGASVQLHDFGWSQ